jgi:ABC-type phosphate/phosphonate transport system substrate-binding protein
MNNTDGLKRLRLSALVILLIFPCFLYGADTVQPGFTCGFVPTSFPEMNAKDAMAALMLWANEVGKGVGFDARAVLYNNVEPMLTDFRKGKVDMITLSTHDYLSMSKPPNVDLGVISSKQGKKTVRYALLVQSETPYVDIRDLKNKKLAVLRNNTLGLMFLNNELLKRRVPEAPQFFSTISETIKESQAVLAVFFGQADACVTTETNLKIMIELNPQIGKRLKTLLISPELLNSCAFFRPDYDPRLKERIIKTIITSNESQRGKQLLTLFNADNLEMMRENDLTTVRQLFSEYSRLKGKK